MPHNIRLFSDVGAKMSMFDNKAKRHKENQMINPFSDWDGSGTRRKLSRDDPNYGRPVEGSKTAERGRQAQVQMIADMVELCDLIFDCGVRSPDGRGAICFGDVFRLYNAINDKCVGLLMRGRKHNILDFEGEMLFQRRDDDKMIELLLPLNTIRYKYGMPERAGCGEVRHDLLEELERQQKERQPPRTRSLEQLGLPLPQLHKSKSMELARDAAKDEDGWTLTVETQNASGRMGRSAENLTRITEDEGAVGGAAAPQGAQGGAADAAANEVVQDVKKNRATASEHRNDQVVAGGLSGNVEGSEGAVCTNESDSKDNIVKWELGSDDTTDNEQFEEEDKDALAQGQTKWPEIMIVVEEDAASEDVIPAEEKVEDEEAEAVENTPREEETRTENDMAEVKGSEVSEHRPSSADAPVVSEEAESERDFWAGADEDEKSRRNSTGQAKRSNSAGRISPSLADAGNKEAVETVAKESVSPARDVPEDAVRTEKQHGAEISETSAVDQSNTDGKAFSFWDVPEQDAQTVEDMKEGQLNSGVGEAIPEGHQSEEGKGFSFWDVEDDSSTEKAPDGGQLNNAVGEATAAGQKAEEERGFSFWDVSEEGALTEQISDEAQSYNDVSEAASRQAEEEKGFSFWNASEEDVLKQKTSDEVQLNDDVDETRNQQSEEKYGVSAEDTTNAETLAYDIDCSHDTAMKTDNETATNGETFSFWDVSEEDEDTGKSHTLPEPETHSKSHANRSQHPGWPDATCHERLPSPTGNAWDATSAEHPSPDDPGDGDGVGVGPRPLAVPHITVSDDSEAAPAR